MSLPATFHDADVLVADPVDGTMLALRDASDRALAHAAQKLAEHDHDILSLKRAIAHEVRQRHGVGKGSAGGYEWTVTESQSWPIQATHDALYELVDRGVITQADAERAMPAKPRPDARALKALLSRLLVSDPIAAQKLAGACSVSPPSVRDVRQVAIESEAA